MQLKKGNNLNNKFLKAGDILIALVVVAALLFLFFSPQQNGEVVQIYKEGKLIYNVPLDVDRTIVIDDDGYNEVRIKSRSVKMIEADCPNQDCVKMRSISKGGMIVCLHNRVVVQIVSGEIDAIT